MGQPNEQCHTSNCCYRTGSMFSSITSGVVNGCEGPATLAVWNVIVWSTPVCLLRAIGATLHDLPLRIVVMEDIGEAGWDSLTSNAMLVTIATGPEIRSRLSPGGLVTGCTYDRSETQAVWNVFAWSTPAVPLREFWCLAARTAPRVSYDEGPISLFLGCLTSQQHVIALVYLRDGFAQTFVRATTLR